MDMVPCESVKSITLVLIGYDAFNGLDTTF